jgi:regulator of protease activity HflC (stomatin/prohibitin superfamily)
MTGCARVISPVTGGVSYGRSRTAGKYQKDHHEIPIVVVIVLFLLDMALSARIVKQYEEGVLFRLGRVRRPRKPGFQPVIQLVDVLGRMSLRIVTMPIQSQGIITHNNVRVDVSALAYFRVVDAVKSVVAIANVGAAIDQIARTTLRKVVGHHTLDQTLSETDKINLGIRTIPDVTTIDWGVEVTLVELKDIQLPDTMDRAMAKQAEAEREKRAKIINAERESMAAALGQASGIMMAHPLALQLRNLQSLVESGVDKNTTVVLPAPLMTSIAELGAILARRRDPAADRHRRTHPAACSRRQRNGRGLAASTARHGIRTGTPCRPPGRGCARGGLFRPRRRDMIPAGSSV